MAWDLELCKFMFVAPTEPVQKNTKKIYSKPTNFLLHEVQNPENELMCLYQRKGVNHNVNRKKK